VFLFHGNDEAFLPKELVLELSSSAITFLHLVRKFLDGLLALVELGEVVGCGLVKLEVQGLVLLLQLLVFGGEALEVGQ
jgi:hypothetical protein